MGKYGACEVFGGLLCLTGLILACVAQGTHKWTDWTTAYSGLWQTCSLTNGQENCSPLGFDFVSGLFTSITKIIHLMGIGFCAIAMLVGTCGLCKEDSRSGNVSAQGGLYITGGVFIGAASAVYLLVNGVTNLMTGVVTGTNTSFVNTSSWGYSYYLSWSAFACLFIGGIWLCCASCQMSKRASTIIVPVAVPPPAQPATTVNVVNTNTNVGYYA